MHEGQQLRVLRGGTRFAMLPAPDLCSECKRRVQTAEAAAASAPGGAAEVPTVRDIGVMLTKGSLGSGVIRSSAEVRYFQGFG